MSYNESLSPNSNYPPMSQWEWDNAPWNEPVIPERDFDIGVTISLYKKHVITTDDYTPEYDEESGHTDANTEYTDWAKEYHDCCYSIPKLIGILENYVQKELDDEHTTNNRKSTLRDILEACQGWEVVEETFDEE